MAPAIDALIHRLQDLDSNLVSDVMDAAGLREQVLSAALRPLDPARRLVGVAVCARGAPLGNGAAVKSPVVSMFDIDAALFPGAVVVLENGGPAHFATIGGFVARSWQALNGVGMLTDGLVRDSAEIVDIGFPVFCGGTSPAATAGRWALVAVGGVAHLPGRDGRPVEIADGDLVIGDVDGVSVVPRAHADAILAAAETLKEIEGRIAALLAAGRSRKEAFAANPRFAHVPKLA